jgi:glycyl-tRNA synthetase
MAKFKMVTKTISEETFVPNVIEPSFGIGRVLYTVLDHSFRNRNIVDQEMRCFLSLPVEVSPIKVAVLPISSNVMASPVVVNGNSPSNKSKSPRKNLENGFVDDNGVAASNYVDLIASRVSAAGISYKVDDSGQAIGRRYARTDEIGIPFAVTVDFQTINDQTVTLRERDSMVQVRLSIDELITVLRNLCNGDVNWDWVLKKYPKFTQQEL